MKLRKTKDFSYTGEYQVIDDAGNAIATVYFDRQSGAWFDASIDQSKHHMQGYLGSFKEEMFQQLSQRKNPEPPPDLDEAVKGYKRFTEFDPQEFGVLEGLVIPNKFICIGEAVHILYHSDKWEGKFHDYIHEHEAGVHIYLPPDTNEVVMDGVEEETPSWLRSVGSVYKLGECDGFRCNADEGEYDVHWKPRPELYAIPSGKALLIIDVSGSTARLVAALWGGYLDVRPEGITG